MARAKKFKKNNKFAAAMKMTKGRGKKVCTGRGANKRCRIPKTCNRKLVLKAVGRGSSPQVAVKRHCPR